MLQSWPSRAKRSADVRRTRVLHSQRRVSRAGRRSSEVYGVVGGYSRLPQYVLVERETDASRGVERSLPEQSDPRQKRDTRDIRRRDEHELLQLRLQRLPAK